MFGVDGIHVVVLEGGHELPITRSIEVAEALTSWWEAEK